jgi:hypothetical protein
MHYAFATKSQLKIAMMEHLSHSDIGMNDILRDFAFVELM